MATSDTRLLRALEEARHAIGQSQRECLDELTRKHGAPARSQSSLSRYVNGRQVMPRAMQRAVTSYITLHSPEALPHETEERSHDNEDTVDHEAEFDRSVRALTAEPLLGPRQAALIDAIITRIASGPSLNAEDQQALATTMSILGLSDWPGTST